MSRRDEEFFPSDIQGMAIGIISGAVLGAATALFLSSKTGERICEACEDLAERSMEYADSFTHKKRAPSNLNMVIGGIAGTVLGLSALFFLSSNSAKGLRKQVLHSIDVISDKSHKMAHNFSDKAHETYENAGEQVASWIETAQEFLGKHAKKHSHHHDEESFPEKALYWTLLGIRFYQSLKKER